MHVCITRCIVWYVCARGVELGLHCPCYMNESLRSNQVHKKLLLPIEQEKRDGERHRICGVHLYQYLYQVVPKSVHTRT